jgi:hypothetical protein
MCHNSDAVDGLEQRIAGRIYLFEAVKQASPKEEALFLS